MAESMNANILFFIFVDFDCLEKITTKGQTAPISSQVSAFVVAQIVMLFPTGLQATVRAFCCAGRLCYVQPGTS